MKIAVCDDEHIFVDEVSGIIRRELDEKNLEYSILTYNSSEALIASDVVFDIAFIDIEMSGKNGLKAAKHILEKNENAIILIVTSHPNYLDEAMELEVYRYISKPIDSERLATCLKFAVDKYYSVTKPVTFQIYDEVITLSSSEIVYASIENRKVFLHTFDSKTETNSSFSYWQSVLDPHLFASPCQGHIVNLRYVQRFDKDKVTLVHKGKKFEVYVSKRRYLPFKKAFYAYLEGTK